MAGDSFRLAMLTGGLLFGFLPRLAPADTAPHYRILERIPASAKYWDYSSIDPSRNRLYVGREGGVLSVDLGSHLVIETLFAGALIHAVLPIEADKVAATDGAKNELKVFDAAANTSLPSVAVGGHPDALAYDSSQKLVITVNKESQDLTLVDAATWKALGSVKLGGDPEFATTNDQGRLFVNLTDVHRVEAVDLRSRKIIASVVLKNCKEPSGIAYSGKFNLLLSVCGSGVLKALDATTLKEVASVPVGCGADAVILDERRDLVFIPAGDDGLLNIVALKPAGLSVVATLKTEPDASSGAVDPNSGRVYLPVGRRVRAPEATNGQWHPPSTAPGSFHILVVGEGRGT
jgi:DNA-binding beta-propeller fold protein YncE